MEANMKTMKAGTESAIDRLLASNERAIGELRADMKKSINSMTLRMIGIVGLGVAILAFIL